MKALIGISIFLSSWVLVMIVVTWLSHLSMTRNLNMCRRGYGNASFVRFRREFCQHEWDYSGRELVAVRHEDTTTVDISNGIVKFNNVGMAMRTPLDYVRLYLFVRSYIRRNFLTHLQTDVWKNEDTYRALALAPTEETMTDARTDLQA